jgi:hypothetical protein
MGNFGAKITEKQTEKIAPLVARESLYLRQEEFSNEIGR